MIRFFAAAPVAFFACACAGGASTPPRVDLAGGATITQPIALVLVSFDADRDARLSA